MHGYDAFIVYIVMVSATSDATVSATTSFWPEDSVEVLRPTNMTAITRGSISIVFPDEFSLYSDHLFRLIASHISRCQNAHECHGLTVCWATGSP